MKEDLSEELEKFRAEVAQLRSEKNRLEEKIIELYILYNVSKALSFPLKLNEIFELAMQLIATSLQVEKYAIMLLDETKTKLFVQASNGLSEDTQRELTFAVGEGIPGEVVKTKKPVLIKSTNGHDQKAFYKGYETNVDSFICVPLKTLNNDVIGVLLTHKTEKGEFTERELELFAKVAEHIAIAIENAMVFQKTVELSYKDPLTHLFNRRYFFERLEKEVNRASRYGRVLSLLMIDVDDFKAYNDRMGHLKGDAVLKQIANIMSSKLRSHDILARFGGEEFIVLLPETELSAATAVAEKLRAEVETFPFEGKATQPGNKLTITIGVSSYPGDAMDSFQLINMADRAMYDGKKMGGNIVASSERSSK